jgi:hypothetical protein
MIHGILVESPFHDILGSVAYVNGPTKVNDVEGGGDAVVSTINGLTQETGTNFYPPKELGQDSE